MKPFEKALIDSILEEYSQKAIPLNSLSLIDQTEDSQSPIEMFSLWVNDEKRKIYLTYHTNAVMFFFETVFERKEFLQSLLEKSYKIADT